jgi:hypothetical protein
MKPIRSIRYAISKMLAAFLVAFTLGLLFVAAPKAQAQEEWESYSNISFLSVTSSNVFTVYANNTGGPWDYARVFGQSYIGPNGDWYDEYGDWQGNINSNPDTLYAGRTKEEARYINAVYNAIMWASGGDSATATVMAQALIVWTDIQRMLSEYQDVE